jgi:hypothetical protein
VRGYAALTTTIDVIPSFFPGFAWRTQIIAEMTPNQDQKGVD